MQAAAPIPVQQVFATLEQALSFEQATRSAAEAQLRAWEGDAAPGFIGSLLKVVAEVAAVPEVSAGAAAAGAEQPRWAAALLASTCWLAMPAAHDNANRLSCLTQAFLCVPPVLPLLPAAGGALDGGSGGQECSGQQLAQDAG